MIERFYSRILRNHRALAVWTPPGYGDRRRRHPVVYFQDGQNVFDPRTAFAGNAWLAGETASALVRAGAIMPPILVGIANLGERRIDEYSPTPANYEDMGGQRLRSAGDGKRYARFVATEVKPFIDAHYLTAPGRATTSVVGSSMGGLAALYVGLGHADVFGRVVAMSPSLWWDERVVLRDFAQLRQKPAVRLWLDMGTAEPGWEVIRAFRDVLVGAGWTDGADLAYHEVAGAEHSERAWGARLGEVLKWALAAEKRGAR